MKNLLAKIMILGTKKVMAICVAGVVATGAIAGGTYVIIDKMNSGKQEAEKESVSQEETTQTVQYEAENIILEGEGLEEGHTLEIKYFEEKSDEYQRAFNSINDATTSVTALEVFEIKLVDKEGNKVELENEVALKITLQDATKNASGEYLLWDSEMITIKDAEFQDGMVSFSASQLGIFVVSKTEKIEEKVNESDTNVEAGTNEEPSVQSSIPPSVNTNQNSIQTQTPSETEVVKEKTWFDKKGFKITPITSKVCFNEESNHLCGSDKVIRILDTKEAWGWSCDEGMKEIVLNIPNHHENKCNLMVSAFDRYTGVALEFGPISFEYKGANISIDCGRGKGMEGFSYSITCPVNYDGMIFVVFKEESWDWPESAEDGKTYGIEDYIDFSIAEAVFFSPTNN